MTTTIWSEKSRLALALLSYILIVLISLVVFIPIGFASNYLMEMNLDDDTVSHICDRDDGLILPHGVSCSI